MTDEERAELAELGRQLNAAASGLADKARLVESAAAGTAAAAQEGSYMASNLFSLPDMCTDLCEIAATIGPAARAIVNHFETVRTAAAERARG